MDTNALARNNTFVIGDVHVCLYTPKALSAKLPADAHAGLMSNRPSDAEKWGWDWEEGYEAYDVINIYGHEIVDKIETDKNHIGIDTGAFKGRRLSAICLGDRQITSIPTDIRDIT